jgi:hypothetical protein
MRSYSINSRLACGRAEVVPHSYLDAIWQIVWQTNRLGKSPHLSPLPQGEAATQRQVRDAQQVLSYL